MSIKTTPLSLSEAEKIMNEVETEDDKQEIKTYFKKFGKISFKKAEEMRAELSTFDEFKVKPEHITKVIDLLPEDEGDLNKIFVDVGLTKDDSTKILEIVKKYS